MTTAQIDKMVHYAIAALLDGDDGWRAVTRDLVRIWQNVEGLQICFSLVAAADAIDENFNANSPAHAASARAYKLAALVAVDVFGMGRVGGYGTKARDLELYWRKHDGYFLTL